MSVYYPVEYSLCDTGPLHVCTLPRKILNAGWDYLVNPVMREGGYVRYDGRKSEQVLRDCKQLLNDYNGNLKRRPMPGTWNRDC